MTVPAQRWLSPTGQSPALDMQGQTSTISAGLSIDVGPYPDRSSWREWLTTDWKDAGGGTVQVSQATMGSVNGKGLYDNVPHKPGEDRPYAGGVDHRLDGSYRVADSEKHVLLRRLLF